MESALTVRIAQDLKDWIQAQANQKRYSMRLYIEQILERERQRVERDRERVAYRNERAKEHAYARAE